LRSFHEGFWLHTLFPWAASGRAIANGRDQGVTKLLFDDSPEALGHGNLSSALPARKWAI
jgi:hypothetical protein